MPIYNINMVHFYGDFAMDMIYHNDLLCENMNKIELHTLASGYARVEHGWYGHVVTPLYSRLYYITDGSFRMYPTAGEPFILEKGHCYLIPAGYSFDYDCDDFMEQAYFHIKLCDFDGIDLLSSCKEPLSYELNNPPDYKSLLYTTAITDIMRIRREIYNSLCKLFDKYKITLEKKEYSPQVRYAIQYIDAHLSIQLNLADIAVNAFTAPSTLTRNFKRETGMTVGQYIDNSVLFKAERMLLSSSKSILEISETLGFCDQFYFARRFKEKFGITPRDYRKMNII